MAKAEQFAWLVNEEAAIETYAPGDVIFSAGDDGRHLYVVRSKERDALADFLKAQNIHTGFHYPVPLHLQNCYRAWRYTKASLPVTERVASEIISLPMFPGLTAEQQQRVVAGIQAFAAVAAR